MNDNQPKTDLDMQEELLTLLVSQAEDGFDAAGHGAQPVRSNRRGGRRAMSRLYPSKHDLDGVADRVARVRARMAAGVRLVEPKPEPAPPVPKARKPRRLTDEQVWTRVRRVIADVERAAKVAIAEQGPDRLSMDDACHDIALSLVMDEPEPVRAALFRGYLGWDPEGDADLYRREGTDPALAR